MKKFILGLIVGVIVIVVVLNIHLIRTKDGVEVIRKKEMTMTDTYVDVRDWSLTDYFKHSPRIRNYLVEKKYSQLEELVRQEKKSTESMLDKTQKKTKELGRSIEDWIDEKF
jgi:hypothetical protein